MQKARDGEDVIIAKGKEPVAKIVAIHVAERPRKPGRFQGKIRLTEDVFDPLTGEELRDWGLD